MKTKISLAFASALFACLALASCIKGTDQPDGGFNPPTGMYEGYAITFASNIAQTGGGGNVYAYITQDGQDIEVRRSHAGETINLLAESYKGFEFREWIASGVTFERPTAAMTSFIMPDHDLQIEINFQDLSLPEPSPEDLINTIEEHKNKPENVALRAWKERQSQQGFVWFDSWSGRRETGGSSLRALPKEITIAANWGQPKWGISDWCKADLQFTREVYGTKLVVTMFSATCGDGASDEGAAKYNIGTSSVDATIRPAIAAYAKNLYENCLAEGYDGYDWDFEPDAGGRSNAEAALWKIPAQAGCFLEELSYYFGTKAQSYTLAERQAGGIDRGPVPTKRMLLLVDGEVNDSSFKAGVNNTVATAYVDYYVQQAYGVTGEANNRSRVQGILDQLSVHIANNLLTAEEATKRCILAENFEKYVSTGGGILAMAGLTHTNGYKTGGFGIYRVGMDYNVAVLNGWQPYNGSMYWYWTRKAIDDQYGNGARE